jgi:hypothetical protein
MSEENRKINERSGVENSPTAKKRYQDPAFRHERIFETLALSCGKVQVTNPVCGFNRKNS